MAKGGQVERFVVVSACWEDQAIVQSRCHGLTGWIYIYTYIHTYKWGMTTHRDYLPCLSAQQLQLIVLLQGRINSITINAKVPSHN